MSARVSVLIPTLNEAENIEAAIESVRAQTLDDVAIIVCDGGSSDDTVSIVDAVAGDDLELIVDRGGVVSQMNRLANAADTEFIANLDADSVMHPTRLEQQVGYLKTHESVGVVGTGLVYRDRDGTVVRRLDTPTGEAIKWRAIRSNPLYNTTILARTAAVESVGAYRDRPFYDYDLHARIAAEWDVANLDSVLTTTLERDGRIDKPTGVCRCWYNTAIGLRALRSFDWSPETLPRAIGRRAWVTAHLLRESIP